jgi:hypothetical protein
VQEKIVHAWLARTVPVYFGPPEAATMFNPESFIDCSFGKNIEDLNQQFVKLAGARCYISHTRV